MTLSETKAEYLRREAQRNLDSQKSALERNKVGQFSTPTKLALEMSKVACDYLPNSTRIRFLDPAIGTGVFFYAAKQYFGNRIEVAKGFEIDGNIAEVAKQLWEPFGLEVHVLDFCSAEMPQTEQERADLIICNPPYVRHHHLSALQKTSLQRSSRDAASVSLGGLAGLYCHFVALAHPWMAQQAVAAWLIPSEFMAVNYGKAIRDYLLNRVTLLRIHRFDPHDVQFNDAVVSSAVVFFCNKTPTQDTLVEFTFGGELTTPARKALISVHDLRTESKWTRFPNAGVRSIDSGPKLADLFKIKRGVATGANEIFILSASEAESHTLPSEFLRPILPSPRFLKADEIAADAEGNPIVDEPKFLLDCRLPEKETADRYPSVYRYLKNAESVVGTRYLCSKRLPWYLQENRPATPLLCTYIGRSDTERGHPFRFILNHSKATAANVYLMLYPKPIVASEIENDESLIRKIWEELRSISSEDLVAEGRVYGGGLHKVEPRELANVSAATICALLQTKMPSRCYDVDLFTKQLLPADRQPR
jgi:hypothetical protein